MKKTRSLLAIILAVLLSVTLSACQKTEEIVGALSSSLPIQKKENIIRDADPDGDGTYTSTSSNQTFSLDTIREEIAEALKEE